MNSSKSTKVIFTSLFLVLNLCSINAQQIVPTILSSTGNFGQTSNGTSLSWTLGELASKTILGNSETITQGFHQTIFTVTSLNQDSELRGEVNVFPNPTSGFLQIDFNLEEDQDLELTLYSSIGSQIWTTKKSGKKFSFVKQLSDLPGGNYFLQVASLKNGNIYSFQINKTH